MAGTGFCPCIPVGAGEWEGALCRGPARHYGAAQLPCAKDAKVQNKSIRQDLGPLGWGLNGVGAHSGLQPARAERKLKSNGSWPDRSGSTAGGERRDQPGTLPSEARRAHGDREMRHYCRPAGARQCL